MKSRGLKRVLIASEAKQILSIHKMFTDDFNVGFRLVEKAGLCDFAFLG